MRGARTRVFISTTQILIGSPDQRDHGNATCVPCGDQVLDWYPSDWRSQTVEFARFCNPGNMETAHLLAIALLRPGDPVPIWQECSRDYCGNCLTRPGDGYQHPIRWLSRRKRLLSCPVRTRVSSSWGREENGLRVLSNPPPDGLISTTKRAYRCASAAIRSW